MTLQHYLPATYLACFSTEDKPERRTRLLAGGDKKDKNIFTSPASKVCGINDLYTLKNYPDNPELIDSMWSFYEKGLALAIDQLITGTIPAITWANTLIPFVTSLLVRGPDFNKRFEGRIKNLGINRTISPDNTNFARLLENQRLSAWFIFK